MEESKEEKIKQLQTYEQNLQGYQTQKQEIQSQLTETNSALNAVAETSEGSYKLIGNIMVKKDPSSLKEELEEKKNTLNLRLDSIQKEENKIRERMRTLQEEVVGTASNNERG